MCCFPCAPPKGPAVRPHHVQKGLSYCLPQVQRLVSKQAEEGRRMEGHHRLMVAGLPPPAQCLEHDFARAGIEVPLLTSGVSNTRELYVGCFVRLHGVGVWGCQRGLHAGQLSVSSTKASNEARMPGGLPAAGRQRGRQTEHTPVLP